MHAIMPLAWQLSFAGSLGHTSRVTQGLVVAQLLAKCAGVGGNGGTLRWPATGC